MVAAARGLTSKANREIQRGGKNERPGQLGAPIAGGVLVK
jgi:hypothetical protein